MELYRVLIVDDEPHIRAGVGSLDWSSIGTEVCGIANNGKEAIDMAAYYRPDLILTDIRMPIVDGLEMAERIFAENHDCVIVFMSGYEDFEYARRALKMGACDYILKPASPEEILHCCQEALKGLQRKRERNQEYEDFKTIAIKNTCKSENIQEEKTEKISVKEIQLYIENHYDEELSLEQLAIVFHFNAMYINRMLKKETGYTFLEILSHKRMAMAIRLLEETTLKIHQVAEKVGVPDQRYFSTMFKKYYGCTPKQYRQNINKK